MATSVKKFWSAVREAEKNLAEVVMLASFPDEFTGHKGGSVVEVSRLVAAKMLVNKTHRLAKKDEIEAYREDQERRRERIKNAEAERRVRDILNPAPTQPQPPKAQ